MPRLKVRTFALVHPLEPEQLEIIRSKISQYSGVKKFVSRGINIKISYDLNVCQYNDIKSYLQQLTTLKSEGAFKRQLANWICYLEKNEIDHSLVPGGWSYYVRRFYLSLE